MIIIKFIITFLKRLAFASMVFIGSIIASVIPVSAHCPLCTGAIAIAATTAGYYGVDISIIGLLVGAFGISTGLWFANKFVKKQYFRFQLPIIAVVSFLLTVIPIAFTTSSDYLYFPVLLFGNAGSAFNKIYWLNKFFLGSIIGGIASFAAFWLHERIKKVRGHVIFSYQGIVFTLAFLAIAGIGLFLAVR